MIHLFVLDVDGCLTDPFVSPDWQQLTEIRNLQQVSRTEESVPELTLCTGRPLPYAEALAQLLDVRRPFVFESGGGLYNPLHNTLNWSPALDRSMLQTIQKLRDHVEQQVLPGYEGVQLEYTKKTDVGVVGRNESQIRELYRHLSGLVERQYPQFEVHRTEISVNVIMKQSNKRAGLQMLSRNTGIPVKQMAYIGDSSGDLDALQIAGKPFAPSNAIPEVQRIARVTTARATGGVLEAYRLLVEENRELAALDR